MKKRVVSMLLAVVMMLGMFPGTALAAGSVEEALGEVNIYNGEQKLSYLSINGRVRELIYTYYNYVIATVRRKKSLRTASTPISRVYLRLLLPVRASSTSPTKSAVIPKSWASLQMAIPIAV